jgi:hypothetical protein
LFSRLARIHGVSSELLDMLSAEGVDWVLKMLHKGTGPKDARKVDMLDRVIELTDEGIVWSGDPRHQYLLEEYFGRDSNTKVLGSNGYEGDQNENEEEDELTAVECKGFRLLAARLNYLAQDSVWILYVVEEICHNMANPKASAFAKIKRIARLLKGAGEVKLLYKCQNEEEARNVTADVDSGWSDWEGREVTRWSTCVGFLKVGSTLCDRCLQHIQR